MHSISLNKQQKQFLLLQHSVGPVPVQVILPWKGQLKLCIECHLISVVALSIIVS